MSRSIVSLGVLGHTPLNQLSAADHFQLELACRMTELQEVVNAARRAPEWNREFHRDRIRYHVGAFHGCFFAMRALMLYVGGYDETYEWSQGLFNEADFLAYDYLLPESARYSPQRELEDIPA